MIKTLAMSRGIDMDRKSLVDEIDTYIDHIAFAYDCYIVCQSLSEAAANDNEKVNLAPGFFQVAWYALTQTLMITLARMYVGSFTNDKTIQVLINQCREFFDSGDGMEYRDDIFDILNDAQNAIDAMRPNQIKNLKMRRDKSYAHNDRDYFGESQKIIQEFPLKESDIEDLLQVASNFCTKLLSMLTGKIVVPIAQNSRDLNNLLQYVDLPRQ
jgi:hypothetical protein